MKRGLGWALVAALAAACAAGCKGPPPGKEEFNNLLATYNRKLARPARAFRKAVLPLSTGQPADARAARAALDDMKKALKEVRSDVEWLDVPSGSGKAQAFLDKYKEYLTMEETLPDKYFKPILAQVEEEGPAPSEKWNDKDDGSPGVETLLKQLIHEEKKFIRYAASRPGMPGGGGPPGGGPPGAPPGGGYPGGGAPDDVPDDPNFITLTQTQDDYCQEVHFQATAVKDIKPDKK